MITAILVAVLTVIVSVFFYLKKTYNYWNAQGVPTLPVIPFLGNHLDSIIMKKHTFESNHEVYGKYSNEKVVGGFRGLTPELYIQDVDLVRSILVKDFNHFYDRSFHTTDDNVLSQNLFRVKGMKWKIMRFHLTPIFTSAKLKQMFPLVLECGEHLLTHIKRGLNDSAVIEVKEIMAKYTTDNIGSCFFGIQMNSMTDREAAFRKMGKKMLQTSKMRNLFKILFTMMPRIVRFFRLTNFVFFEQDIVDFFTNIVKKIIGERTKNPSNRFDFIDQMIDLRAKGTIEVSKNDKPIRNENPDDKLKITDDLIIANAFVFFLAGFDTSSTLMCFALLELAINPDVQDKLYEEIDTILAKYDNEMTYEGVNEMKYLFNVINETLRKYPPLPFLDRVCRSKYKIPNTNIVVDEGVFVTIPTYSIHHDSKHFPEPEKFKPERFSSDSEEKFHPFAFLPFGEGPRNCIGLRFGKLQSAVGLINILKHYSVHPCDETRKTLKDYTLDTTNIVIIPLEGTWLRFEPRK